MTDAALKKLATFTAIHLLGSAAFVAISINYSSPAWSAGSSGSSTVPSCRRGLAWDKRKGKCVRVRRSSNLSDNNIYEVARDLAYNKRYGEAIDILKMAQNQNDPRILNYLGYSTRKSGDVEKGLTYYQAAIEADPDYTLARSYMGEAFLQLNKIDEAREQLAEIGERCGVDCREFKILKEKIAAHKTS